MPIGYKYRVRTTNQLVYLNVFSFVSNGSQCSFTKAIHQFGTGLNFSKLITIVPEFNLETIIYRSRGKR